MQQETLSQSLINNYFMTNYKGVIFLHLASALLLNSCASSAQIKGIKVIEENNNRKYTQIKTEVFKSDATILRDTTNEFNRYPSAQAVRQYTPSLSDVQAYEEILKNSSVPNERSNDETFVNHFKKFNRQYSGYIDKNGDTIIVVCFIDFSNKKKAKEFFSNWKYQNIYLGSGLFLDRRPPHIYCYSFDRRTKEVNRYTV